MNKSEFKQGINKIELAYNQRFSVEKLQLWWNSLSKLDNSTFQKRINELIKTKKYVPNIAEILQESERLSNFKQRDYSNVDLSYLYVNNDKGGMER